MKAVKRLGITLVAVAGLVAMSGFAQHDDVRTRGLIVSNYETGKTDGVRILVKMKSQYGDWAAVDPGRSFKKGDEIKVSVEPNFDGYVYIVNIMPTGKKRVLFPFKNETNNMVHAHQHYDLPNNASFSFDEETGVEILQTIMSRDPIPALDSALGNPNGDLDDSASSAAAELAANTSGQGKSPGAGRGGIVSENVAIILPQSGPGAVRSRSVHLAAGKDKDEGGSVVGIPDDKAKGGKLKSGEVAVFEIRLKHI
jgi:hypothetical protein